MPNVDITIGKRTFQLSCEEGQEPRLKMLAGHITDRIKEIAAFADSSNETVLLAMASLMMQDELLEAEKQGAKKAATAPVPPTEDVNAAVADAINTVAEYIENITARFEKR
ncbi:MAG: cell division protein ZapA [Proteobacteria bacterium]|nr:cell division protein ZapA [Pseudomonadota bacterium]